MADATGRVPLLDESTDRLPDKYLPPAALQAVSDAQTARNQAQSARNEAQNARTEAIEAADRAEAVGDTNDAIMAGVAANPSSAFATELSGTITSIIAETGVGLTAVDATASLDAPRPAVGGAVMWLVSQVDYDAGLYPTFYVDGDIRCRTVIVEEEFSPLSVAGVASWFDAQAIAQADASDINSWANGVAGAPAAVPYSTTKPKLDIDGLNGRPAVAYVNNGILTANGFPAYTGPMTIYVVAAATTADSDFIIDARNAAAGVLCGAIAKISNAWRGQRGAAIVGAAGDTLPHIFRFIANGTASSFLVGSASTAGSTDLPKEWVDITLGGRADGTSALTGVIGEVVHVKGLVSAADDAKMMSYLRDRWGL